MKKAPPGRAGAFFFCRCCRLGPVAPSPAPERARVSSEAPPGRSRLTDRQFRPGPDRTPVAVPRRSVRGPFPGRRRPPGPVPESAARSPSSGGHSTVKVLLSRAAGSTSASTAHTATRLRLDCLTVQRSRYASRSDGGVIPVSSSNSRRAASNGSSSSSMGTLQNEVVRDIAGPATRPIPVSSAHS